MRLLSSSRIAGNTARLVETRFFNIVNASVCDKENYCPRTLQFVENIMGCPLVPSTQRWIARVPNVDGLFENQQDKFIVDSQNPKITYIPINQFHPSASGNYANLRLAKFEETPEGMKMVAANTITAPNTNAFIREIVSQSTDFLFVLAGTSNTNRIYLIRVNKSDLSSSLVMADVGASIGYEYIGESGDEMLFLRTLPATAAGRWTLEQRNKLTNASTTIALLTGHTSAITSRGSVMKQEGNIVTHYRAYQKPTTPFNWIISKVVFDLSKIGSTAATSYMTSKVDLEIPDIWLPAVVTANVKLQEVTTSTGNKYLVMFYMQSSTDTELAMGDQIVFSINPDTGNLTKIAKHDPIFASGLRGFIPLNNGRSLIAITRVSASFAVFDQVQEKYVITKEMLVNPSSIGVTANEDILITTGELEVLLGRNTIPININTSLKTPIVGNIPASGLANSVLVTAINALGEQISTKTKLQIDGINAIWQSTGNREVVVTTSSTDTIEVPLMITSDGDFAIRAGNE